MYSLNIQGSGYQVVEARVIKIEMCAELIKEYNQKETSKKTVKYTLAVDNDTSKTITLLEDQIDQIWFTSVNDLIASIKIDEDSKD